MTVSSENRRADYNGDGATVAFPTGFRFLQDSDLKVIKTVIATGIESVLTLNSDYTVVGAGDDSGGTVTTNVAPASSEKLSILRSVSLTQETDYVENDEFPAESHEKALDKLTMISQQLQEVSDRTLKLSESQVSSGLTIPPPVDGKYLRWDDEGNLENVDIADQGLLAVGAFGETLVANETALGARTDLDVYSTTQVDNTFAPLESPALTGSPTAPTQSPADNSTKIATTAYVEAAVAASPGPSVYTSPQQAIVSAGQVVLAHGLGAVPNIVQFAAKCLTAEHNYSIGDVIGISMDSNDFSRASGYKKDATNITIRYSSTNPVFNAVDANTGALVLLTNANWEIIATAVKF